MQNHNFGKWRSFFWPIQNWELKKFIPMAMLFFFINFNYTILRDTKDALIVNAPGSGAEAIPFLKVWGVLPFAILFMLLYSKLSNVLSKPKLFYSMISIFIGFFAIFALVLYPYRDVLHPNVFCDNLLTTLPKGFTGLIAIIRNWTSPCSTLCQSFGAALHYHSCSGALPTTRLVQRNQNDSTEYLVSAET